VATRVRPRSTGRTRTDAVDEVAFRVVVTMGGAFRASAWRRSVLHQGVGKKAPTSSRPEKTYDFDVATSFGNTRYAFLLTA
jgi:hypothetical protein